MTTEKWLVAALLSLIPMAPMCASGAEVIAPADTVPPGGTRLTDLSDAQITQIVRTANDGEIKQGKLAEKRSGNLAVQSFAKMMVDQHEQVNKELGQVAKTEHIRQDSSADAKALSQDANRTYSGLKSLSGPDFDKAYVDAQVKAHQDVLDSIDHSLLPNAKDLQLQAVLQKIRPAVQTHLEHAKKLLAQLSTSSQTG